MAKSAGPEQPFSGHHKSRRARRRADRRADLRAAARAEAMPAPDPTARRDPATGAPMDAGGAFLAPVDASLTTTAPGGFPDQGPAYPQQGPTYPQDAPTYPQDGPAYPQQGPAYPQQGPAYPQDGPTYPQDGPAGGGTYTPRRSLRLAVLGPEPAPQVPDGPYRLRTRIGDGWAWLHTPARPGAARGLALAGVPAGFLGVALAAVNGLPLLGHGWNWAALGGGLTVLTLVAGGAMKARGGLSRRWRRGAAGALALLCVALVAGVVTNPALIHGKVVAVTSKSAHQYALLHEMEADIYALRDQDVLLTYAPADAGAHFDQYVPAMTAAQALSAKYATMPASSLPDPGFAGVVDSLKSAAYWANQALAAKEAALTTNDAKYNDAVTSARANYAAALLDSGRALGFLSAALDIPLTSSGVHE